MSYFQMIPYFLVETINMDVSKNRGTPKSSILIGFSMKINHPFWGVFLYFWKHPYGPVFFVGEDKELISRETLLKTRSCRGGSEDETKTTCH